MTAGDDAAAAPVTFTRTVVDPGLAGYIDNKAVGDINGDGLVDIVVGTGEEAVGQLVWYLAPTWTKTVIATGHNFTTDMQVGDVDGDGDIDVITPEYDQNQVVYYRNPRIGGGSWTMVAMGTGSAHDLEVGDVDGDGKLDVVFRGHAGATTVLLQVTPSSWTPVTVAAAIASEGLALGDINRDGKLDIAQNGYWLQAPADPANGAAWTKRTIDLGWQSDFVAVSTADVNADGRLDVLLARSEMGRLSWYEAPGDPVTGAWIEHVVSSSVDYVHTFKTADMDRDGDLDVAFAEMQQSTRKRVGWFENGGGGGTTWTTHVLATTGSHNIRVADIGNDNDLDIVGANWQGGPLELWVAATSPAPSLDSWAYKQVSAAHEQTFGLAFGDLNQDSRPDVVSGRHWYSNPGDDLQGTWAQGTFPGTVHAMLVVDVDGDALADVIGQNNGGAAIHWMEATTVAATAWTSVQIGSLPASSHGLGMQGYRVAQLEAGGRPEIAFSSWNGGGIQYFRIPSTDPGAGNWPRVQVSPDPSDEGFGVGDIDADGDLDIAASPGSPQNIQWYRNPGNGSAGWSAFTIATASDFDYVDRFEVADMNGDGRQDILASEENGAASGAQTSWWERPVDPTAGGWVRHTVVADQGSTNSMDVADMDGDGDIDVVTGEHRGSLRVRIWENDGTGRSFTAHQVDSGKESHDATRLFDLDGDGDRDITTIGYDTPQFVHLWRNGGGPQIVDTQPPAAPGGLTVTGTTSTQVDLAWSASTDNVGVVRYSVFRNGGGTPVAQPTTTSFRDTGVSPATTYSYTVRAVDGAGNVSGASNTVTTTTPGSTGPPAPTIDDFTSTTLAPVWTFTNPGTDSTASLSATPGHLALSSPSGTVHDCWANDLSCPRVMRPVADADAVFETRINGANLSQRHQSYGILLWADAANYVRFEYWSDGDGKAHAAAWRTVNGAGSNAVGPLPVTLGAANHLRVTRTGSTYKLEHSQNGTSWSVDGTFTQAGFAPTQAGLFLTNDGSATQANFDYWRS